MGNLFKHFRTILVHKHWVSKYCKYAGIPKQGFFHDLSKFSPIEFFESAKYYTGKSSPIDECKKHRGVSTAWLHHKSHNKHHYEYWIDNLDCGGVPIMMPYKYALEMICDFLGAARAYNKNKFSYQDEVVWWFKKAENAKIHPQTKLFVGWVLLECAELNSYKGLWKAPRLFDEALEVYPRRLYSPKRKKCNDDKDNCN